MGDSMRDSFADILGTLAGSSIQKRAISNPDVLNEAYAYATPSSFSRGLRIDLVELTILLISGTASIDEHGNSVHIGDFRAQMRRTLHNITGLLAAEDATWHDVVRTTCYLRDIDRDYASSRPIMQACSLTVAVSTQSPVERWSIPRSSSSWLISSGGARGRQLRSGPVRASPIPTIGHMSRSLRITPRRERSCGA
jgi:enamine deaminase RidA (YjgF/YER057c/UK114 family)